MKTHLKKTLKNVSFMILLLKICIGFSQKKIIVIDPGHGGKDAGAIGINNIQEKDVALSIAKAILRLNKTVLNDAFEVYLTRYKDTLISLSDRTRLAKSLDADVFVSLHCNASPNPSKGIEVYVHNAHRSNTKASLVLGASVLNESTQKLGFKKRSVKLAGFQVLRGTTFCPAVLLELGFVTHIDEADYFLIPKNIKAMALAVIMGISNYLYSGL